MKAAPELPIASKLDEHYFVQEEAHKVQGLRDGTRCGPFFTVCHGEDLGDAVRSLGDATQMLMFAGRNLAVFDAFSVCLAAPHCSDRQAQRVQGVYR